MPSRRNLLLSGLGLSAFHKLYAQTSPHAALDGLLSLFDFETEAQKHISHGAWARISGAAADELTLRWNHEAYEHIRLKPRALVDVSKLDTSGNALRAGTAVPDSSRAHRRTKVRASRGRTRGGARRGGSEGNLRDQQQRFHACRRHRENGHCARMVPALRAARPRLHAKISYRARRLPAAARCA